MVPYQATGITRRRKRTVLIPYHDPPPNGFWGVNFSTLLLVLGFQALVMNPLLIFLIDTDSFTGMEDTMDFTLDFLGIDFLGLGFEACFFIG